MVIQIIEGGLRLTFTSNVPAKYEEPNTKSFRENELFGCWIMVSLKRYKRRMWSVLIHSWLQVTRKGRRGFAWI